MKLRGDFLPVATLGCYFLFPCPEVQETLLQLCPPFHGNSSASWFTWNPRAGQGSQRPSRKLKGLCTFLSREKEGGKAQKAGLFPGLRHLGRESKGEEKSIECC